MTLKVIWLDKSTRQKFLEESFGSEGDWFKLRNEVGISLATHLVVHFSDLTSDGGVAAFKSALEFAVGKSGPVPLVVVYSGALENAKNPNRISNWVTTEVTKVVKDLPPFKQLYFVMPSKEGVQKLWNFLEAETPQVFNEKELDSQIDVDVALAIDLVAEVSAWLSVSQAVPPEMKEFKSHLNRNLDGLLTALSEKIGVDVSECVNRVAEEKKAFRVDAWKKAGMISG